MIYGGGWRRSDRLTLVNRFERRLLPAIETLTELDLGDRTRTEVSNVSGIGAIIVASATVNIVATIVVTTVIHVGVIGRRVENTGIDGVCTVGRRISTATVGTKWEGIRLRSKRDSSRRSGVEEQVRIVGSVLSLNETIKLTVRRSLLAKDGISEPRRIRGEVWRGVLLSLAILHGCGDHLLLSISIELAGSVCSVE